jgi:mannose/fructose/N-acetylgalactosamine-specific phosphotransferase system component IID
MRNSVSAFVLGLTLLAALPASGAELTISANQSVESVLSAQKGKRVSVRLRSGQEISGTVKNVTPKLVQLAAIAGKEFFDAVVPLEAVEAVLIRTKE